MAKLKTGRHTTALKVQRQTEKHTVVNREVRTRIRTLARKVEAAVASKDAPAAQALLKQVFSMWDKAAQSGVVHWRAAGRKKARLSERVRRLAAAKT